MPKKFYPDKLYPFQDAVLRFIQQMDLSFYLTGGTVLSRGLFNHRYSDDLDFFVNDHPHFKTECKTAIDAFRKSPDWLMDIGTVTNSFVRLTLEKEGVFLKIDFVNDVSFHWGGFESTPLFYRIDNWRNILSNKICAMGRRDVKDIIDILFIADRYEFPWDQLFDEAKEKDLWADPLEICKIIKEFPVALLDTVKWISPVNTHTLTTAVAAVHDDIFWGKNNSLFGRQLLRPYP